MKFACDLIKIQDRLLIHKDLEMESYFNPIRRLLKRNAVDEELGNKYLSEYKLTFYNHAVEAARFITFVINSYTDREEFCNYLFIFIKQFYPNSKLVKDVKEPLQLRDIFNKYYGLVADIMDDIRKNNDLELIKKKVALLNNIFEYFTIIEEFMIRFYNYSIVGISNNNYIVTARSDCDKKFIDYLLEGYALYRLQKIGFINDDNHFDYIPVIPTKDVGFPIDEYIEVIDDEKTNQKKMLKML